MSKTANSIFGYFESAEHENPSYDPGPNALCPICMKKLGYPENRVRTVNLMRAKFPQRSFFYRMHLSCAKDASDAEIAEIEGSVIDSNFA
jgi:hypothetical protein